MTVQKEEKQIPEWLRKKMAGTLSPEEYGQVLDRKVESGEITADEAEHEYQDFVNPEPRYCGREW